MSSVTLEIAKKAKGEVIRSYGEIKDSKMNVSVALWTAGKQKFLLLKAANKFLSHDELPLTTSLSQAIQLQEEKLVALQGGKG